MEKNPKRVAAGKLNRAKRGSLSEAGREHLREAALRDKPWLQSTGPRTTAGKASSASNGRVRQVDSLSVRQTRRLLAGLNAVVAEMTAARAAASRPVAKPSSGGSPRVAGSGGRLR